MHDHVTAAFLTVLVFSVATPAQVGPGQISTPAKDPYLSTAPSTPSQPTVAGITVPAPLWPQGGGAFRQVHTTKSGIEGLGGGQFAMTLTVNGLNPFYTGRGGVATGVVLGMYDTNPPGPVFTPTLVAKNMNPTTGSVFGLMVEPRDGLFASVDWTAGPVLGYRASRRSAGADVPFGTPVLMTDSNSQAILGTFVDPAVCYVNGQLTLLYVAGSNIEARPLTVTITGGTLTKAVYGNPTAVASVPVGSPHSPTPLVDNIGNAHGLFLMGANGADSDSYIQGTMGVNNTPDLVWDNPNWQNNGALVGGTLLFRNTADSSALWRIDVGVLVGSRVPLNGIASVSVHCKNGSLAPLVTSTVAGSTTMGPPVPIPGWIGSYALGSFIATLTATTSTNLDNKGTWATPVPNNPALRGLRLPLQALAIPVGAAPVLTNTAWLEIF